MARRVLMFIVVALAAAIFLLSIGSRLEESGPEPTASLDEDPLTGAILVDLEDDADRGDLTRVAGSLVQAIAPVRWPAGAGALGETLSGPAKLYRLTPPASELADVLAALRHDPDVEAVELERSWSLPEGAQQLVALDDGASAADVEDAQPGRFRPNDPYYKHQWHLDQIQMPQAWMRSKGQGAVVAIIDTGVLAEDRGKFRRAPDLAQTRFVKGRDFVDNDDHPDDEHGHGTHVAGTVAQSTNNGVGVAGVAPEAAIMPIRVLDKRGAGRWGAIAASIRWAADNGAHVINMSLGGGMPSQTVRRAIDYAHGKGVTIIAAAGNANRARVEYPAAHKNVVAVGAVRFDEQLTFYSSYGRGLALVAPGGDLRVDQNGDGKPDGVLQNTMIRGNPGKHDYVAYQGTSMATPHVAGVAALLYSAGVRDPDTIEQVLVRSAKDKHDRRKYGAGLVQADDALRLAKAGFGGARGFLALAFGGLLLFGLRRQGRLAIGKTSTLTVAFVVAGGLALVPWSSLPWVGGAMGTAASGLPSLLTTHLGEWVAPLAASALVPFGLAAFLLGVRRAAPVVVGTSVAFAAWLFLEALLPTAEVGLLPAALIGPWLLLNAAICGFIARLAATRPR